MAGDYQNGSNGMGGSGGDDDSTLELYQFFGQIGTLAKWVAYAVVAVVLFSLFIFGRSVFTDWLWFDNLGLSRHLRQGADDANNAVRGGRGLDGGACRRERIRGELPEQGQGGSTAAG